MMIPLHNDSAVGLTGSGVPRRNQSIRRVGAASPPGERRESTAVLFSGLYCRRFGENVGRNSATSGTARFAALQVKGRKYGRAGSN
ncbi:MAG: hypothetical protein WD894_12685 [Pirellulales bacterium]